MAGKIRVLYIDDEPGMLDIGKQFLEQSGDFTVTTATSAPGAIRLLEQERFDAIVSDYQMPEMDGIEILKHLKAEGNTTPFIIITGKGREEVVIEALNEGADFYIQKGGESGSQFAELSHKIKKAVERSQVEKALVESELFNRNLITNLPDYIAIYGPDGKILYINPPATIAVGYTAEEVIGTSVLSYVAEEYRARVISMMTARHEGDKVPPYEIDILSRDGRRIPVIVRGTPLQYHDTPAHLMVLTDITERKRAENFTRTTLHRLNTLCSRLYAGVLTVSEDGKVEHANQALCDLFKLPDTPESLSGLTSSEIIKKIQNAFDAPARMITRIREITAKGKPVKGEEIAMPDGRVVMVDYIPIIDVDGQRRGRIWHLQDITGRKQAELALRESEAQYRILADNSPSMIYLIDPDGYVRFVNPVAAAQFGLSPQELTGKHLREIYPRTIADQHMRGIHSILDQGTNLSYEIKESFPTGERWLDARMTPVKTGNGTVIGVLGISNDITERKRVEEALRESEELFKSVVHNSSDLTILADAKGIVTYVSPQCDLVIGYPGDKFIGQTMPDIIYPDDVTRCLHAWEQVIQHGQELRDFEYRIVDGAGAVRWVSHSTKQVSVDGRVLGIQSDIRNITERKRAVEALVESEEKFHDLLENAGDLIQSVKPDGSFIYVNRAWCKTLGYTQEETHNLTIFDIIHTDSQAHCKEIFKRVISGEIIDNIQAKFVTKDGKVIEVEGNANCRFIDGKPVVTRSIFRDITERKRAADTIALTSRKLALINDVTYQYIQNKVTGLMGYATLYKTAKTDAERVSFIEKEDRVLADIYQLIKNTREYQEIGLIQPRWIPVEQSIRIAVSLVSPRPGISVESALPGLELYFDPIIEKIFAKLIDNAIIHGKTTRRITFSCHETPDMLILICEDDGAGISPKVKTRLFDMSVGENIRFGLFFIRECLLLSGMTIAETSTPGKGARFEIHIPAGMWRTGGKKD